MKNSQVSFGGCVPIYYYAKNPATGKYSPVMKKPNITKCQSFVVRNLNGSAKKMKNDAFVKFYEKYDADYRQCRKVKSIYDKESPKVFMLTGKDAENADIMAKPIGKAKGKAKAETGNADSIESKNACNRYYDNIKDYINNSCKRLQNSNGEDLSLHLFYEPQYNKKQELKGFKFVNAGFKTDV